jgi:AcrR family transcriptional regulator
MKRTMFSRDHISMVPAIKSEQSVIAALAELPAHWEERSAKRVLDAGRDQILERSRKIVEAAYDLLEEGGLEGLTVRAVLNKTGLSRRAFYERFEGKDDLVLAVFEQTIRAATLHFSNLISTLAGPIERLELIVTHLVLGETSLASADHSSSNRRGAALSREHLRMAESRPHDLQAALSPLIALIARQLSDGMASGAVRSGNPQRLATLVYNLVSTTVHTELLSQESAQPDRAHRAQLAADIWEFCRRAIVA